MYIYCKINYDYLKEKKQLRLDMVHPISLHHMIWYDEIGLDLEWLDRWATSVGS